MLGSLFPRETDGIWLRLLSRPHANIEAFKSFMVSLSNPHNFEVLKLGATMAALAIPRLF